MTTKQIVRGTSASVMTSAKNKFPLSIHQSEECLDYAHSMGELVEVKVIDLEASPIKQDWTHLSILVALPLSFV
jgi:hypothetical protein